MIIAIINQKGGVGKTTVSVNVSDALSKFCTSNDVLLVDADPQLSTIGWSQIRDNKFNFDVLGCPQKTLARDVLSISSKYKYVVIDGPPGVTELTRSCIIASDLVLIPCTPSGLDVRATEEAVKIVDEARIIKEGIQCAFVINRKIVNTAIGRDVVDALEYFGYPVLSSHVCQRVAFADATTIGQTIYEYEPEGLAAKEITSLTSEIIRIINKEGSNE